jgi:BirA family biotin operon repressor/biotin-[acetyl-CoA-carboxylase] ligase
VRPLTFSVLRLLSEREFRSGEALARSLDVSRGSVWGALNEAQGAGLQIHRVHGRGYRLAQAVDWLDAAALGQAIAPAGLSIEVVQCCESTNAMLLAKAETGCPSGHVLAAEVQTRGRGRLGRVWHSGVANALTFSMLWRFDKGVSSLSGLSLGVGAAIARVLNAEGVSARLKWPNDVLYAGRKLGGILIEVRGDALGPCAAVVGVGINIRIGANDRRAIDQPVADLADANAVVRTRNEWLSMFLLALAQTLTRFAEGGFGVLREVWNQYCAHLDRRVRLTLPDGTEIEGVSRGVDEYGRLLLERGGIRQPYMSADVSLRVAHAAGD